MRPPLSIKEGVQQMDRQFPPQRTKVQIVLGADREVELALERMQNQVHLIHDQTPITQQLQNCCTSERIVAGR